MFNGIIFNKGIVNRITKSSKGVNIFVKSNLKVKKKDLGVSICCDGVCLTMISLKNKVMEFYLLKETMNRSKFKNISIGDKINLELPLKYGQKISGHLCQGHVDCTSKVNKIIKKVWPKENPFPYLYSSIEKYIKTKTDKSFLKTLKFHKVKKINYVLMLFWLDLLVFKNFRQSCNIFHFIKI